MIAGELRRVIAAAIGQAADGELLRREQRVEGVLRPEPGPGAEVVAKKDQTLRLAAHQREHALAVEAAALGLVGWRRVEDVEALPDLRLESRVAVRVAIETIDAGGGHADAVIGDAEQAVGDVGSGIEILKHDGAPDAEPARADEGLGQLQRTEILIAVDGDHGQVVAGQGAAVESGRLEHGAVAANGALVDGVEGGAFVEIARPVSLAGLRHGVGEDVERVEDRERRGVRPGAVGVHGNGGADHAAPDRRGLAVVGV